MARRAVVRCRAKVLRVGRRVRDSRARGARLARVQVEADLAGAALVVGRPKALLAQTAMLASAFPTCPIRRRLVKEPSREQPTPNTPDCCLGRQHRSLTIARRSDQVVAVVTAGAVIVSRALGLVRLETPIDAFSMKSWQRTGREGGEPVHDGGGDVLVDERNRMDRTYVCTPRSRGCSPGRKSRSDCCASGVPRRSSCRSRTRLPTLHAHAIERTRASLTQPVRGSGQYV